MRALALLLLLPALALGQVNVTVQSADTIQSACNLAAANATCTVVTKGKSSVGFVQTANNAPSGVTILAEMSMDGTNYVGTYFDDPATGNKASSITTGFAVGLSRSIIGVAGARFARVRMSARTSGDITITVTATDMRDPSVMFAAVPGAASVPPVTVAVGVQDATTATTFNALKSAVPNTTPGSVGWLLATPALSRSAVNTATAGNATTLSVDATNGSLNTRITDSTTYLSPQVNAHNTAAPGAGMAVMPFIARSAVSGTTAGRSAAGIVDTTTGFQVVSIGDGTAYNKAGVDSNSTGQKMMIVASTADSGLTSSTVTVNTTTNVKASAGEVYGVSCANANASTCFLQFYNTAGSPTCGTSVIWSLALPSSGTLTLVPGIGLRNHATGIAVCMGTTATGATACTTANSCTIFYK